MTDTAKLLAAAFGAAGCWPAVERALAPRAAALMALRLAEAGEPDWPAHLEVPVTGMLSGHAAMLAAWIDVRRRQGRLIVGLAGGQGSGKSTLAGFTAALLRREFGARVAVLGLDDLYLPRAERAALANSVHPLFATRGVPGTHDVGLGVELLDRLMGLAAVGDGVGARAGGAATVALPRFDKGRDERMDPAQWVEVAAPVDVVIFEGWCVGAPPQDEAALTHPCNDLERQEDAHGVWRRSVNAALMGDYQRLFGRMGALVYLRIPDFAAALRWREEQEAQLRTRAPTAMTPAEVIRFVAHYERLTVALRQASLRLADLLLELDDRHRLVAVTSGGGFRPRGFRRDSAL